MSTMEDTLALLCKVHNEKILDSIKRKYPGIDQILTPEKITAYDRGEYDDLDALPAVEMHVRAAVISYNWATVAAQWTGAALRISNPAWAEQKVRQYEAELISRYKAGLL